MRPLSCHVDIIACSMATADRRTKQPHPLKRTHFSSITILPTAIVLSSEHAIDTMGGAG